jgi:hypothetical protein
MIARDIRAQALRVRRWRVRAPGPAIAGEVEQVGQTRSPRSMAGAPGISARTERAITRLPPPDAYATTPRWLLPPRATPR